MKTFVIDIDGVIAESKTITCSEDYVTCKKVEGASEATLKLYNSGVVILYTARREEDRAVTEKWLDENVIYYHHLVMGKPFGDVYIDDRALRFVNWKTTNSLLEYVG